MRNTIIAVVVLILIAIGGWFAYTHHASSPSASSNSAAVVATVNGQSITQGDLMRAESQAASSQGIDMSSTTDDVKAQLQSQALDTLIAQQLLSQAAAAAGITASSSAVDAQLASTKSQFGSADAYTQALAAQGMTEDQLRAQIASDIVIQQYLEQTLHLSAVTATDAEIQDAYNQASSGQQGVPPLSQVKDQVTQMVVQQKQQALVQQQVATLRAAANVQILIPQSA